jgi:two-component system chemotaxis response regulator CheB
MQEVLTAILNCDDELKIVGVADNGQEAIEKVESLRPDFVTMDITMPVMDGLEAIGHIMDKHPLPIMVITDIKDAKVAFHALSLGALDVFPKSDVQPEKAELLIRKTKILAKIKVLRHIRNRTSEQKPKQTVSSQSNHSFQKVVAIACSTGGPKALAGILSTLPADFPYPILISQHIENSFIASLVDWINHVSPLTVKTPREGESLAPATAYISPANKNMIVDFSGKIIFDDMEPTDIYHPSCNKLLSSVGQVFGKNSIGVVLTGMGNDGLVGIKTIKSNGGITIAQDEASSIVFGMPREAIESGYIDTVLPLGDISKHLAQLARNNK